MQDNRTLHTIEILMKFSTLFKGTPYKWDKRNKCIQISSGGTLTAICRFLSKFNVLIYLIYQIASLLIEFSKPTPDFYNVVWLYVWVLFYIWGAITYHNAEVCCKDVTAMFKGVKKFHVEMEISGKFGHPISDNKNPKKFKHYNLLELQIMAIMYIVVTLNIVCFCMFLAIPRKPQYLAYLVTKQGFRYPLVFILFAIYELYSKMSTTMMMVMDGIHTLVMGYVAVFWMEKVRRCKTSTRKKILEYRKLQILVTAFNHSNTKVLIPFVFFWGPGAYILLSTFACIRFYGHISIFEYIPFPATVINCIIILILAVASTAPVQESSLKLYQSILIPDNGISGRQKIIKREMRALQPFGISIQPGSVILIRRIHICEILYIISDTLMTLLATYPPSVVFHASN